MNSDEIGSCSQPKELQVTQLTQVSDRVATTIQRRGGIFNASEEESDYTQKLIENAISRFAHHTDLANQIYFSPLGKKLRFAIINCPKIGAFACVDDDSIYLIGIYIGSVFVFSSLVTRMLNNKFIFPYVGNPEKEGDCGFSSFIPIEIDRKEFSPCRPRCQVRSIFSRFLMLTVMDFIFLHELSHIVRGHLGLKNKISFGSGMSERVPFDEKEEQALELDADVGATEELINYSNIIRGAREKLRVNSSDPLGIAWRDFYEFPLDTIKFSFFASYSSLRVTNVNYWSRESQSTIKQPLPPFRMGLLMKVYADDVLPQFDFTSDQSIELVNAWCLEAEQAFVDLQQESGQGKLDLDGINTFFDSVEDYFESVVLAYEDLKDDLKNHSFEKILNPTL